MKRFMAGLIGCALVLIGGCVPVGVVPIAEVQPLPYRFILAWSSQVADPYYVLAGPSESYRRFPFNAWAESALEEQLALRSSREGAPLVKVAVKLREVTTDYRQVGEAPVMNGILLAGFGGGLASVAGDFDQDGGRSIPEEIYKSARLDGELELYLGDRLLTRQHVASAVEQLVRWEDFDAWSYDYGSVLQALIADLRTQVDQILLQALPGT
ncbi:hypothetical protein JCM30471_23130 [Desulfuromonas carbonis]|uniref:hypothetical protein n=1 Tax=Desulfuromonas sp. DDH964 TaxID=1823759 RepID=UPI00078EB60B|nr:hypothetical protein [Desulfuromonas sp. DDH964]AMV73893.1 hypothetical protein DBW_3595 [Desulfuromonas sp. DDH964]